MAAMLVSIRVRGAPGLAASRHLVRIGVSLAPRMAAGRHPSDLLRS